MQEHRNTWTQKQILHIELEVTRLDIGEPRFSLITKVLSKTFSFYTSSSLLHYDITIFFPLPICRQELCIVTKGTDLDTNHKIAIPILFLCNMAVYGLPFQPHAELTPVCRNDSGPC